MCMLAVVQELLAEDAFEKERGLSQKAKAKKAKAKGDSLAYALHVGLFVHPKAYTAFFATLFIPQNTRHHYFQA